MPARSGQLRVGIDLYPLCRPMSGVGMYIKYLMREMLDQAPGDITFFYPSAVSAWWWPAVRRARIGQHLGSDAVRLSVRCFPGAEIAGRLLPMQWARFPVDLYHITSTLCWFRPSRVPTVVTAYDLAWMRLPESIYPKPRHLDLGRYPKLLKQARHVACISEATKRDVAEFAGVPEERLSVTLLAARPEFRPPQDEATREDKRKGISGDRPYLLAVGTLEPRKNYPRLIAAFAKLVATGAPHRLLIVGGDGPETGAVRAAIVKHGLQKHVELKGYLGDEQLIDHLWGADALVMVSLYEGFGLPVLEAMACGTPVIAARAGSLEEVGGEAAIYADPLDVDSIFAVLERVTSDRQLRENLKQVGLKRAEKFNWADTARRTIDAYRRACA